MIVQPVFPEVFETVAAMDAAQCQDVFRSRLAPEHARLLAARANHGFTTRLNDARADKATFGGSGPTMCAAGWPLAAAQGRPKGGRRHQNLTVKQEAAVLVPFQTEARAARLITVHGVKTRYETRLGHAVPDSTVYRLLARHHWRQVTPRPKHPKNNPAARAAFKKLQAKVDAVAAGHPDRPLRLMFEDEARFGRMSSPVRCRAPAGCRPEVPTLRVREYTNFFGSVCPQDGELISLILPHADTPAMSLCLAEVAGRHPHEHILMFMDRAGWRQAQALVVPANITVDWLPPYSPQCNPQELVWREVRRQPFGNHDFDSMDLVETALENRSVPEAVRAAPSAGPSRVRRVD
jgi:hypothetical protein